ncbi:MAG: hypothetical protein A2289_12010 [Deltaproteobacteria bacterium RIFOXYA12_FULL_58_15]|nr:MAG: hypothetical protein A2289_12010 [Deltaproteobacteria bacterium RIFOXYA12_FULL_58_15]OGR07887.1 MAG: hypothetical protein A2341_19435 [Deltaproteobacteria bacterium RIFOXYB12_FULL_58_9]
MCGRFTLSAPSEDLSSIFNVEVEALAPRYNIAPTQMVSAVRVVGGKRHLALLRWGLVPSWAKDPKVGARLINARAETVAEKPSFRSAFRRRRCLIVADGFYEWQKAKPRKQPFHIACTDGRPFAMAGLWEFWSKGDVSMESCTIITTAPNELLAPIHDRMPVILEPRDYDTWLDPEVDDPERLTGMLQSFPADQLRASPVGHWVNNAAFDHPSCMEPVSETPTLF